MGVFRCRFALKSVGAVAALLIIAGFLAKLPAQYYTEHFDNVPALWSNGWAQQNRSALPGSIPNWFQGDPGNFAAFDGGDTAYIAVSYNCGTGSNTLSNWLFTPTRTFSNGEKFSFRTRTVSSPNYPDRLQVRLSLNGASTDVGTTATSVGDFTTQLLQINPTLTTSGYPNAWTEYTIILTGLSAPTSGRIAFRYFVTNGGSSGANSEYIGIDSVAYYLPPAGDLRMRSIQRMEYTIFPERHTYSGFLVGNFQNYGSTTVNDAYLQVNVYDSAGIQIYSANSAMHPNMAPGDIVEDSVPAPTGLGPGSYTLEYIAIHSASDGDHSNDTLRDAFEISPRMYARDNGTAIGGIGIGAYVGGFVGQGFHLNQADNLDSIWVHVTRGFVGQPLAVVVWDMLDGMPNQIMGSTDTLYYSTDSSMSYVLPLHGGHLQLPAGDFVVTMVEFDSTLHLGMSSGAFFPGTTWLSWPTLPAVDWRNVEFFGLNAYKHPQMIRPILSRCAMTVEIVATPPSSTGAMDGMANAVPSGGTPPFSYIWNTGNQTNTISGLGAASPVSVTVTDAAGCRSVVALDHLVGTDDPFRSMEVNVYPNPNEGTFRVSARSTAAAEFTLQILDVMGRTVMTEKTGFTDSFQKTVDLENHPSGIYFVRLQTAEFSRTLKVELLD